MNRQGRPTRLQESKNNTAIGKESFSNEIVYAYFLLLALFHFPVFGQAVDYFKTWGELPVKVFTGSSLDRLVYLV